MPKNVRPFWVNAQVTNQNDKGFGPAGKDGDMTIEVLMREAGKVVKGVRIECITDGDKLILCVFADGKEVHRKETTR